MSLPSAFEVFWYSLSYYKQARINNNYLSTNERLMISLHIKPKKAVYGFYNISLPELMHAIELNLKMCDLILRCIPLSSTMMIEH